MYRRPSPRPDDWLASLRWGFYTARAAGRIPHAFRRVIDLTPDNHATTTRRLVLPHGRSDDAARMWSDRWRFAHVRRRRWHHYSCVAAAEAAPAFERAVGYADQSCPGATRRARYWAPGERDKAREAYENGAARRSRSQVNLRQPELLAGWPTSPCSGGVACCSGRRGALGRPMPRPPRQAGYRLRAAAIARAPWLQNAIATGYPSTPSNVTVIDRTRKDARYHALKGKTLTH
jgi:hypothetical protein